MSTGIASMYTLSANSLPQDNQSYFANYGRPYKQSVTLNNYSPSLFNNLVGYNPTKYKDTVQEFVPAKKTNAVKRKKVKKRKLRKNVSKKQDSLPQTPQPQPLSRWARIGKWFAKKYDAFNNFIEQPFTTTMRMFKPDYNVDKKITFCSATTQSLGNIAVKIIAMPLLAPLAVAGLMYTSIKPMIQYWHQQ